jgi:phosphate transport system substrate-binding protein
MLILNFPKILVISQIKYCVIYKKNAKIIFFMSQKNETSVLVLSLFITVGLIGGGIWWFTIPKDNSNSDQSISSPINNNSRTFAGVKNVPRGLFRSGGSTTWAPIRSSTDSAIQTVFPEFQLVYTQPINGAPGSGKGIEMLLDNQLSFSQSSRSINESEREKAKSLGIKLKEIPVAIDAIAIAVNPNQNIPGLTISQVKDIYTGKITNWQEVGGKNEPIIPYTRRLEEGGTVEFFNKNVMNGESFGSNIKYIPTTTQALREVFNNPGAIYYASAPEVVPQCGIKALPIANQPNQFVSPYNPPLVTASRCSQERNKLNSEAFQRGQYPITRRLFIIINEKNSTDKQAGETYANLLLTEQGQDLIEKAGFVKIKY